MRRLGPRVEDRESVVAKRHAAIVVDELAESVRAAATQTGVGRDQRLVERQTSSRIDQSRQTAHGQVRSEVVSVFASALRRSPFVASSLRIAARSRRSIAARRSVSRASTTSGARRLSCA